MNQDMDSLARVLDEESRLYHRLSDCLSSKRDALVRLDRRHVAALSQELDVLIAEVRRVSSARTDMVRASARALGCRGETLRALAEQAPEPYRTRFASLRRDLLGQVQGMERLTGLCKDLIGDSLAQVHVFVRMLAGLAGPNLVYANPRLGQPATLVDRTA